LGQARKAGIAGTDLSAAGAAAQFNPFGCEPP